MDVRLSTVARMAAVLGKRIEWTLADASEQNTPVVRSIHLITSDVLTNLTYSPR